MSVTTPAVHRTRRMPPPPGGREQTRRSGANNAHEHHSQQDDCCRQQNNNAQKDTGVDVTAGRARPPPPSSQKSRRVVTLACRTPPETDIGSAAMSPPRPPPLPLPPKPSVPSGVLATDWGSGGAAVRRRVRRARAGTGRRFEDGRPLRADDINGVCGACGRDRRREANSTKKMGTFRYAQPCDGGRRPAVIFPAVPPPPSQAHRVKHATQGPSRSQRQVNERKERKEAS